MCKPASSTFELLMQDISTRELSQHRDVIYTHTTTQTTASVSHHYANMVRQVTEDG